MPAKGKSRVTDAQRRKLAAGRIRGKTSKQLAADTGLAVSTVKHQVVDPRTRAHAFEIKTENLDAIGRLVKKRIQQLSKELDSRNADVRHNAGNQIIKFACMGDPPLAAAPAPGMSEPGGITIVAALALYAEIRAERKK